MIKSINKVIKTLIISDLFLNSAWGLFGPVFALFIVQNITVGDTSQAAKVAGTAAFCYWIVKSFLQIPIGKYLDKNHGEKDDFLFMFFGVLLSAFVPIGFLFSSLPWHIYAFNILHAVSMALVVPSWYAIFTRHIDRGKEAFEWGTDSTSLGLGVGLAGALGGIMVSFFGFKVIFILSTVINIISALLLLVIRKEMAPKDHSLHEIPPSRPL